MRREGNIIEEIITPENMEESFWTVLRGGNVNAAVQGELLLRIKKKSLTN